MRTLLAIGLAAAVSATAGAQFGGGSWAAPMRDVVTLETAAQLATPEPTRSSARSHRDRDPRNEIERNPYEVASSTAETDAVVAAAPSDPEFVEANPYFDETRIEGRRRTATVETSRSVGPITVDANPYRDVPSKADVEPNPYLL